MIITGDNDARRLFRVDMDAGGCRCAGRYLRISISFYPYNYITSLTFACKCLIFSNSLSVMGVSLFLMMLQARSLHRNLIVPFGCLLSFPLVSSLERPVCRLTTRRSRYLLVRFGAKLIRSNASSTTRKSLSCRCRVHSLLIAPLNSLKPLFIAPLNLKSDCFSTVLLLMIASRIDLNTSVSLCTLDPTHPFQCKISKIVEISKN